MQYFVDHYGEAFLYAIVLLLVLVMVLPSGGVMGRVGNSMTSWQDTDMDIFSLEADIQCIWKNAVKVILLLRCRNRQRMR